MKICIVGGGISGLSAALLVKNKAKKLGLPVAITLFEKENRLGGTIFTKQRKIFKLKQVPMDF